MLVGRLRAEKQELEGALSAAAAELEEEVTRTTNAEARIQAERDALEAKLCELADSLDEEVRGDILQVAANL